MNKIYKEETDAEPTQQTYLLTTAAVTITGDKPKIQRTSHKVGFSSIYQSISTDSADPKGQDIF